MSQFNDETYSSFLGSKSKEQWKKIGVKRRSGVLVPLFSVYSKNSLGIGEIPDIDLIADWCNRTSMSIIQLLPMNDTGFNFTPYDCQSTFALDPVYIRIEDVEGYRGSGCSRTMTKLREKFPAGTKRVNYKIKGEKLKLLWKIFKSVERFPEEYEDFVAKNHYWSQSFLTITASTEEASVSHQSASGVMSWLEMTAMEFFLYFSPGLKSYVLPQSRDHLWTSIPGSANSSSVSYEHLGITPRSSAHGSIVDASAIARSMRCPWSFHRSSFSGSNTPFAPWVSEGSEFFMVQSLNMPTK